MQEYASSPCSSSPSKNSRYTSSSVAVARTFRRYEKRMMMSGNKRGINVMQKPSSTRSAFFTNNNNTPLLRGLVGHPQTPSPFCSYASTVTTPNTAPLIGTRHHTLSSHSHSLYATDFSSPRKQLALECDESERSNKECYDISNCFSDIDEWLEHANKFCMSNNNELNTLGEEDKEELMRISVICKDFLSATQNQLHNITLPSIREESPVMEARIRARLSNCIYPPLPTQSDEGAKLLTRHESSLANKHQLERRARNKAKHAQLMHTLRRKEEAIHNWESQQTKKAMDHMDKIQNKLEKKQMVVSTKTQKKICSVREKAEKQKLNLRRSTMKKFQQLQLSENQINTQIERSCLC
ncbi:hypothetical protein PIB30_086438 [Stylosanthes scabra]|uniref:Remorin C-terminal domain-containing protein n=1 Tax=Stylosanthes scabra TaxID=79078 RepID=A0ABU6ZRV6_9FABA|nr:hypothetical protein [Stylosanthes scabra]